MTIQQFAPGSDGVLLDGAPVASLVRKVGRNNAVRGWLVGLFDETSPAERSVPFTAQRHAFGMGEAALERLGIQGADTTAEPIG